MKKVLLVVFLLGLGIWGCSENTSITSPESSRESIESQRSFLKVSTDGSSTLMKKSSVSKKIDGEEGGTIKFKLKRHDTKASGWLLFEEDSFEGEEKISIELAKDVAALNFEPSGIPLELPAILTLKFSGLDIDDDDDGDDYDYDFQYIGENGELASVEYEELIVDEDEGTIIVVKAKLHHFSTYGFTK